MFAFYICRFNCITIPPCHIHILHKVNITSVLIYIFYFRYESVKPFKRNVFVHITNVVILFHTLFIGVHFDSLLITNICVVLFYPQRGGEIITLLRL